MFEHKGVDVRVEGVSRTYRTAADEVHALRESSWEVRCGEAVAIMGPSGCGKTTLLNLLGGVDRPTTGKIVIDGEDLAQMSERALEKHRLLRVGFVFQLFNLIPSITALENLELPMVMAGVGESECRRRAKALLDLVGLEAKGQKRPEELSGGEQQRVAIALALANDPALILADEPTGNLDDATARAIMALLCSSCRERGATLILVTHDREAVHAADRILELQGGILTRRDDAS